MTNKTNGIDVSECSFCLEREGKQKCATGFGVICYCEDLYNCYFKQLKRLQKENEKLKNKNNDLIEEIASGNVDIAILQKENEKLKDENKNYAKLMLVQEEILQKHWECIEEIKQAIEVLAETCNVYPLKTNLDKLITIINEALDDQN